MRNANPLSRMFMRSLLCVTGTLSLAACGGGDTSSAAAEAFDTPESEKNAAAPEPVASPSSDQQGQQTVSCNTVAEDKGKQAILGVSVGMTADQAAIILNCRGYRQTFPIDREQQKEALREMREGVIRFDFLKTNPRDFVRLFVEGSPNAEQVFYIGRGRLFEGNPPTMKALGEQFLASYDMPDNGQRNRHGAWLIGSTNPADNPVGHVYDNNITKHCADMAFMHNPDDAYSSVLNRAPYPDQNCGQSMSFEAIPDGRNDALVYVARYRLANPQLGYQLREARKAAEETAAQSKLDAQTRQAEQSGTLPDL